MKNKKVLVALATSAVIALTGCGKPGPSNEPPLDNAPTPPPYSVQLVEHVNANLPNLHSFTHAIYQDKIIMFGGRKRGLHASGYNFSQASANKMIYVIDTHSWSTQVSSWTVHSRADSLTLDTTNITLCGTHNVRNAGQFRANNAEFFSNTNTLYVIGGLIGATSTNTSLVSGFPYTFPYISAVTMSALVTAVINQTTIANGNIRQVCDNRLALTGGEVAATGNSVTLTFGWNYNSPNFGSYSHQISTLTYTDNGTNLSVTINAPCPTCIDTALVNNQIDSLGNGGSFRRRDGSMSPMIDPLTGNPNLMYYAGVFKNGNTNFTTPVWLRNDSALEISNFDMRGNVYTCEVIPVYSKSRKEFYATMLGGMTNTSYSFTTATETPTTTTQLTNLNSTITTADVTNFLSVPFFNGITTLKIDANRNFSQFMMATTFPTTAVNMSLPTNTSSAFPCPYILQSGSNPYNGSESEVFWHYNSSYNYLNSDVLDLDSIASQNPSGINIGYHFGGILSIIDNTNMNNGTNNQERLTVASNRIFEIKLIPNPPAKN
ncbi:MAG: hypothetical protein IT236_18265 [Bacteroidia bacterium]|nr:hypothetical protein [Bacteroidia bacterium]